VPFDLGDQVSWRVFAADPATIPERGLPRFVEEHDSYGSNDAPRAEVSGTVMSITGLYYPQASGSGRGCMVANTIRPFSRALQTVDEPDGAGAGEFLVQLEIPDDVQLPGFVVSAQTVVRRRVAAEFAGGDPRRIGDTVTAHLERLTDEVKQRWGHLAEIRRSPKSSAVTVIPHTGSGCVVGWVRQERRGQDRLHMHAGEGVWVFPAGVKFVQVLGEFIAAAAAGRIEEQVRPASGPPEQLRTVVYAENGYNWTAITPLQPSGTGNSFMEAGSLWRRAQRGNHDYPPWAISE
jgi:hypothetical protein